MHSAYRAARSLLAACTLLAACAYAQTFTPKSIVQWDQGGDRERAMLTEMGVGDLAQGQYAGIRDEGPGKGRARFERVDTWDQQASFHSTAATIR